ncbi:hypothetical protein GGI07_003996 [Coemansia sp. Benny D115]|nr:hypothetical protein GGI07_003996 [Coemansia sp. Benny D115]
MTAKFKLIWGIPKAQFSLSKAPPPPPPPAMQAPPQAPPPAPPAPPAPVASDRPTLPTAATFGLSAASAASENRDVAARNQGPTQHSGIDAFSDDDSDSDDESVKLFSFDKVKVRTDNAAEQSSPVINISGDQIMAFAGTLAVANPGNVNPMRNSTSDIPSTNDTNTTKGVSNALVSEEDPLSQPSTMSSTSKSVLEKFPVPPKSKLRLSVFPTGHKQDVVDQWIESNTQNEVPKVIPRNIGKGTDMSTSLANSELDLVIPGKFAAMEGNNIEKSSPTQASKPGASIYGESGFVASVNDSIMSMPGAAAAAAKGKQPEINGTYTATPVAAPRGLDSTNVQKTEQDELDEPLLDSSDLSLRRPTLVDYQKKADAKRKMLEELNQSQKQQQQVGVDDSRYFSAVSLPHNQAQSTAAAAAAGIPPRPFMRIDEDQEEGFLDSDSDDDEPSHVERAHVAPKSAQPNPSAAMSVPNAMGSSDWRPTSVNFDTLAAQVAMALQPATNHDSYVSTNDVGLRDSLMIKAQTPAVSPLRLEHAATSPSQKATVFNRNLLDERFDSPLAAPPRDSLISFDGLEIEEVQPSAVVQKK